MKDVRTMRYLWDRMRVCPQAVSHSDSAPWSLVPGEAWDHQQQVVTKTAEVTQERCALRKEATQGNRAQRSTGISGTVRGKGPQEAK